MTGYSLASLANGHHKDYYPEQKENIIPANPPVGSSTQKTESFLYL
jgi:hypothetical protein